MNKNKPIKNITWIENELTRALYKLDQQQDKPLFTEPSKNSKQDKK